MTVKCQYVTGVLPLMHAWINGKMNMQGSLTTVAYIPPIKTIYDYGIAKQNVFDILE